MKFYHGEINGTGHTSRSGTMSTGLKVQAHSKQGSVVVQLSESAGITHAKIYLTRNPLTGKGTESILFDGPVAGYNEPDVVITLPPRRIREVIMPDPELLSADTGVPDEEMPEQGEEFFARARLVLPPPQRRAQPGYSYRSGVVDPARLLTGPIFGPAGNELADDHQDYDCNEGYAAEPRRPLGKLTLLPDESD